MGCLLTIVGFVYWACTQPTEFDGLLKVQKDFIDDLYSGELFNSLYMCCGAVVVLWWCVYVWLI